MIGPPGELKVLDFSGLWGAFLLNNLRTILRRLNECLANAMVKSLETALHS